MPKDSQPQREQIKVTDKRIFTPEGELREQFRDEIHPRPAPVQSTVTQPPPEPAPAAAPEPPAAEPFGHRESERARSAVEKGTNPGTPFAGFLESLIVQGYMSLGMLRNPYQPQAKIDAGAARQMIDILNVLQEKTAGNLTVEEQEYLSTHLGELKLAFVQRTKSI